MRGVLICQVNLYTETGEAERQLCHTTAFMVRMIFFSSQVFLLILFYLHGQRGWMEGEMNGREMHSVKDTKIL